MCSPSQSQIRLYDWKSKLGICAYSCSLFIWIWSNYLKNNIFFFSNRYCRIKDTLNFLEEVWIKVFTKNDFIFLEKELYQWYGKTRVTSCKLRVTSC